MRLLLTLLITIFLVPAGYAEDQQFERLKSLAGDWVKEGDEGGDFYISFQLSAKGSVLIENWLYKGASHSLTLYHADGDGLMATHYCPQGNQPRLKTVNSASEHVIAFGFQDATNLKSIEDSHQHSLSFEFIDDNTVLRREAYMKAGTESPSVMKLVRR